MHYLLIYDVVEGYVEKRAPLREAHLRLAEEFVQANELLLGGALAEPVDKAILLFRSAEAAEAFVAQDPYVQNKLVISWSIRIWNTVAGSLLAKS